MLLPFMAVAPTTLKLLVPVTASPKVTLEAVKVVASPRLSASP